jgi:aminoethylphosphonate catabolism LysR family transcriptional regulator
MLYTQLRSFHWVAKEGSFTRASQALRISQPTITTQVKGLEEYYGVELFYRHGRGVILTDVGKTLYAITQSILKLEMEASDLLSSVGQIETGHLHVGAVGPFHVMKMLAAFNKQHDQVHVSVSIGNSEKVLRDLFSYSADVAILADVVDDPRLYSVKYAQFPVVLFLSRSHPWSKRKGVQLRDLHGETMIMREEGSRTRRAIEEALERAGVKPNVLMEIESRESMREAVAEGLGVGVISQDEFVPDPRMKSLPILGSDVSTCTHVACLSARRNVSLIKAFYEVVIPEADVGSASAARGA